MQPVAAAVHPGIVGNVIASIAARVPYLIVDEFPVR
jgi:hypothetical protein